jgi:serine/threonine protein kinase
MTQDPETKEYIIVMQYADNGNLLSYLNQNINKLTWMDKLRQLSDIALYLHHIHREGSVHCDLHGGNIVLNEGTALICDLGLSRSVNSRKSDSTIRGVLPFIAPEVFHICKFTQKSDVYSFGIIMYLMATGEPPFRDRQFDEHLAMHVCEGLRPVMPDSAPEEYKKLAERCCDADPDKRPDAYPLYIEIFNLVKEVNNDNSDDNVWNTIYHNDVKPLLRLEKESKYSSILLPIGDLPKPRNSYGLDSAAGMKTTIGYK